MGNRCCRRKKYQTLENEAERALEELKREVEEAENDAKKLDALARLGSTYHDQRKFQEAIQYHKEVLEIAKRVENAEREEARAYVNLGNAYRSRGDFKYAFDNHEKALKIAERSNKWKEEKIDAYGDLGTDYYYVGDFTKARQNHRAELIEATASLDKAREGRAYSHLGTDQFCFKEYEEAIEHHIKHLMIAEKLGDKKEEGNALGNIGIGLRKTGKFDEAKKYHEKELALANKTKNKVRKVNAYLNLGCAHRGLTNFRRARIYHWWGSYLAEEDAVKGDAFYKLGRDLECMGYLEDAAKKYQSSVEVYNKMRRSLKENDEWAVSFRDFHQKAYTALWRTLSNLHKSKDALFAAEQGRAQALVDLLHLRHNVKEKDHSHDAMRTYLSGEIETQTVFFAIESNKIKLWVFGGIHKEEIEFRQKELDVFTVLQRLVKSAHDQTTAARNSPDSLRNMYDLIILPIRDLLRDGDLIIVPDRELFLVPYNALQEKDDEGKPKYLFEAFRIRIVPSLTSLKLIADLSSNDDCSGTGALLVGNTRGDLEQAETEVQEIGKLFKGKAEVLIHKLATKKKVLEQMKSAELIHIATHADTSEDLAWINLYEPDQLTMTDVKQAGGVKARLVVLSCCKSGQGKVTADGVVGIARAFLGAGARSVVATLWEIGDDKKTKDIMKTFYEHLKGGHKATVSFQKVMEKFRSDVKHWIPFILIGDDVTLSSNLRQCHA